MDTIAELPPRPGRRRPAGLVAGDDRWTWAEVVSGAGGQGRLAERATGAAARSTSPLLLDNVPEHVLWLGGGALAGAVVVGANPTHRGDDLARDLAHTQCQFLVTDSGPSAPRGRARPRARHRHGRRPSNHACWWSTTATSHAELSAHAGAPSPTDAAAASAKTSLGYLIFTSGTSGAPKACRCTQGRLARIGTIVAQMFSLTADDVCYVSMPLFHSNALDGRCGPAPWPRRDRRPAHRRAFSASGFLADVRRHGVTYFNYVGKPLSYILATPEQPDDADNPLMRVFGNEGAEDDVARFAERFGCTVVDSTGRPRAAPPCSAPPTRRRVRWAGRRRGRWSSTPPPAPSARRRASTPTAGSLNAEEAIGELVSKPAGPGFEGYWRNDEAELARLRNGWYWTGDLAYRDEAGFFYFAGRPTTGCASTARTSRPPRWPASSSATPTSCSLSSTPCPTSSWATR